MGQVETIQRLMSESLPSPRRSSRLVGRPNVNLTLQSIIACKPDSDPCLRVVRVGLKYVGDGSIESSSTLLLIVVVFPSWFEVCRMFRIDCVPHNGRLLPWVFFRDAVTHLPQVVALQCRTHAFRFIAGKSIHSFPTFIHYRFATVRQNRSGSQDVFFHFLRIVQSIDKSMP